MVQKGQPLIGGKAPVLPAAPAWSFGAGSTRDPRSIVSRDSAAPGQYGVPKDSFLSTHKTGGSTSFGVGPQRTPLKDNNPVAPSAYGRPSIEPTRPKSPAYTLYGRVSAPSAKGGPDPGTYNVTPKSLSATRKGAPSYSMYGRIDRQDAESRSKPGPGAYDANPEALRKHLSTSIKGRLEDLEGKHASKRAPGPGAYGVPRDALTRRSAGSFSIYPRLDGQHDEHVPGPGTYQSNRPGSARSANFAGLTGQRFGKYDTEAPAPGAYFRDVLHDPTRSFNIDSTRRTAGSFSIYGRLESRPGSAVPGPGTYGRPKIDSTRPASPLYSLGRPGSAPSFNKNPGPGAYEPRDGVTRKSANLSFSMLGRIGAPAGANKPGPGAYDDLSSLKSLRPASSYSIGPRLETKIKSNSPGPVYDPKLPKSQSYSFGRRVASPGAADTPGPGAYAMETSTLGYNGLKAR